MQKLMTQNHAIKVSVEALTKAAPFAAQHDIRYYLNGIAVIPLTSGGVIAAATNGHAVVCVRDPNGHADRTVILPINGKRNKPAMRRGGTVRMTDDGAIFTEVGGKVEFIVPESEIDGRYLDLQHAFGTSDKYKPGIIGAFNLQYLKLIDSVAKYEYVRFWTRSDGMGMFTIGDKIFGGLMPLRERDPAPEITELVPGEMFLPKPAASSSAEG